MTPFQAMAARLDGIVTERTMKLAHRATVRREVKELRAIGVTYREIGRVMQMSAMTAWRIVQGRA